MESILAEIKKSAEAIMRILPAPEMTELLLEADALLKDCQKPILTAEDIIIAGATTGGLPERVRSLINKKR